MVFSAVFAQSCPSNLGFEDGTFTGWKRYATRADSTGLQPINWGDEITAPEGNTHLLLQNKSPQDRDQHGGFPVNSPNGSNYTLKLGNEFVSGGGRNNSGFAERITYDFIVPDDDFTMIYYYAVVFQNITDHTDGEQPKFTANVINLEDPSDRPCGSFNFTATAGLHGFVAGRRDRAATVYYKPWSPITIRISGRKGKRFQLEFITRDCSKGGHFGYTYLDFNEKCVSPITGNNYCAGAFDGVNLTAPAGFENYTWTNAKDSVISKSPTLRITPAPPDGTMYKLHIMPYEGLGCENTFTATITKINEPFKLSVAGYIEGCAATGVNLRDPAITQGSSSGLTFEYYTDPDGQNFISDPGKISQMGDYYIRGSNAYGCTDIGKIHVQLFEGPPLNAIPQVAVCAPNTIDLTKAFTTDDPGVAFDYFTDAALTVRVANPTAIDRSGYFYVRASSRAACTTVRSVYLTVEPIITATDKVMAGCPPLNLLRSIQDGAENANGATFRFFTDAAATKPVTAPAIITQSGTYYYYAVNRYGCIGNVAKIDVTVYPVPYFTVYEPLPVVYPLTVDITRTHTRVANPTFSYWTDAACTKPLADPQNISVSGTYYIRAINGTGCIQINKVTVLVQPPPEPNMIAPNTFTPNGDGVNDLFAPKVEGVFNLNHIKIYNRHGKEVFTTNNKFMTWSGQSSGSPVPVGTYYWVFSAFDVYRKKEFQRTGMVTVIR
ncbi:hypothetical protein GCM10028827_38340 [Mucilaginibacter myungsuensis]